MRVLVTGAHGSVGEPVVAELERQGHTVLASDIGTLDVTQPTDCVIRCWEFEPEVIVHLAGAKHAPEGEQDPAYVTRVNVGGTRNILQAARSVGAKVVMASTCKACDPETVYGASKLIAERLVLNDGGVVVRYYNVRETAGNVFRLWETIPLADPIPYTDCTRYFISLDEAVRLTVDGLNLPSGRYTVDPGEAQHMREVAHLLYPGRRLVEILRRRGDRITEPLHARSEQTFRAGRYVRIVGAHDPAIELAPAA